jgi:hypothetical protein
MQSSSSSLPFKQTLIGASPITDIRNSEGEDEQGASKLSRAGKFAFTIPRKAF